MKTDSAIQFMVLDILREILNLAHNPSKMASYITEQMRELVACKMVVLIGHDHESVQDHHRLIGICPERKREIINENHLFEIAELSHNIIQTTLVKHHQPGEINQLFSNFGGELSIVIPLLFGNSQAGVLIMIDISNWHNIDSTIDSLNSLAGVLALELRNASFYEKLEEKVEHRTKQLRQSELRFEEIFNSTSEAIFIDDAKTGRMIDSNQRAVEMYGYSNKEELINQEIGKISANIEPYTNKIAQEKIALAIQGEPQIFEWLARKKNGDLFWVEVSLKSSKISGKKSVIAVVRDISERKIAEQKIQAVNEELSSLNEELATQNEEYLVLNEELQESMRQINEINQELEIAKLKAEESERLKTMFLANMSHEIRTPMNSIMGFASLLPDEESKELLCHYANIIVQNSEQLVHIIDDIVIYSRFQAQMPTLIKRSFDICELLHSLKLSFSLMANQQHIELLADNKVTCPKIINTDHEKLKQVFSNLISNAFKYTPSGSIRFGAETIENQLVFFVKDSGIGIPAGETEKVFDRFFRGSNTRKETVPGTGLGLSIVKELIDLLGGKIWVESKQGRGSTFYFTVDDRKAVEYD